MAKQNADMQTAQQDVSASASVQKQMLQASGAGNRYSEPFKADAVRLVTHEGYTIAQAAKAVGVSEKSLREWHRRQTRSASTVQNGNDDASTEAENRRLREQLRQAEVERDILKKAARVFANDKNRFAFVKRITSSPRASPPPASARHGPFEPD